MSYLSAFSQVALVIPDVKGVVKDKMVSADIRIKARDSISGLQFTLEWNPLILQFDRVDSLKLQDVSTENFGTTNTNKGLLSFIWIANTSGVVFADSFSMFRVFFKAIGAKGTNSSVKFSSTPVRIKVLNPRVESLNFTTKDGLITIDGTSALKNDLNTEGEIKLYPNIPNPISNQTVVPFELEEADDIKLQVYDSLGRLVIEKKGFYSAGKHEWQLNTEGVLQNGLYRYGILSKNHFISKTFIKM
jgi:hypothetical protein